MAATSRLDFEHLLAQVGSFGPYQVRVFVLVSAFEAPAAWMLLQHVFAAASPSWVCPVMAVNATSETWTSGDDIVKAWSTDYNRTAGLWPAINVSECSPVGLVCSGRVYASDYTSIVTEWDLVCRRDYIRTWIMTIQMAGVLVGACVTGQLADTFGRRRVFFAVYALLLLAGFMSSFANSWQLYATTKFFIGAFFGGTMLVNFVLPLEFVGRKWRTFCGCIGFWACGVMSLALLAYLIRDWRYLSMVTALAGTPLLFIWWFVPESPRWLVQQGHHDEAVRILTHIAEFNGRPTPDLSKLTFCSEDAKAVRMEEKRYSYYHLFRTCSMSKNTLILLYAWFVCSSVYYGTSLNLGSLSGNKYLNFFLSGLVEIPPLIIVVIINNRLGRRKTLCSLMLIAGFSMLAILIVDMTAGLVAQPTLTTILFMLGRAGIAGSWAAAQIFSAEVFPTVVRNIGVGACSMSSRIGGIVAPQMVSLSRIWQVLPFVIFGGLAVAGGLLTLLLPETLNQPLPDSLPPQGHSERIPMASLTLEGGQTMENENVHKKMSDCTDEPEVNVLLV